MITSNGLEVPQLLVNKYLKSLIGQFYKILPIKENDESTLVDYMSSLQRELIGCKSLIIALNYDELYLRLISILQFLIDNNCTVRIVRSEVFKAINLCKQLDNKYKAEEVDVWEYGKPTRRDSKNSEEPKEKKI